jgi:hypothetical protein
MKTEDGAVHGESDGKNSLDQQHKHKAIGLWEGTERSRDGFRDGVSFSLVSLLFMFELGR